MKNIWTLFRREFTAYFINPIGYVFLAAFILFANLLGLFVIAPGFFDYPVADMRKYFHVVAGISAFLVAAVTMRLWAEERKGNTFEMLLTLPMRARELTLGKFLAAWAFYSLALGLTLTVPLMMILAGGAGPVPADSPWSGLLDAGAAASGYLGLILLGGMFIAFGLFVSGLCSDQIVAFVLTAPVLFFAFLLGLPFVEQALDKALSFLGPGLGGALGGYVGVFIHFNNLSRGLLDLGDVLFFAVWILLFLILNSLSLERRGRRGGDTLFLGAAVLVFAVGAAANWVFAEVAFPRADLTSEGAFTVSEVTSRILSRLPEKLRLRYHVTPRERMPASLQDLERDLVDQLDALVHASAGRIEYQVIYREVSGQEEEERPEGEGEGEGTEAQGLERRLFRKIRPFSIEALDEGRATAQLIYSALEITYPSKKVEPEVLPCVMAEPRPPAVAGLGEIEYRVAAYARKATRERQPVAAIYAPVEMPDQQLAMLYAQMGRQLEARDPWPYLAYGLTELEGFTCRRVMLEANDPLPAEFDLLVVVGPEKLNPRQQYEINLALAKGKPVILAAQRQAMKYEPDYNRVRRLVRDLDPGLENVLPPGLDLAEGMLMADPGVSIPLKVETVLGAMPMPFPAWPMHVELSGDALTGPADLFRQAPTLRLPWTSPLKIDPEALKQAGLDCQVVVRSNSGSWIRRFSGGQARESELRKPGEIPAERFPVAALVSGTFPLRFSEKPAWPPASYPGAPGGGEPGPAEPLDVFEAKPGKLFIIGNAMALDQDLIRYPELSLLLNAASRLALDADDAAIRDLKDKASVFRLLNPLSDASAAFWKALQVAGHALFLTLAGLLVWRWRLARRRRAAAGGKNSETPGH
ncbi:MAG: Gldg family protein [Planctomycetota bacterium]|jgi:ABC-type transport system involved in multi-copper enzyme maturation permease subunit|nr:Gldg family protein [Planctomycetota bacterium]